MKQCRPWKGCFEKLLIPLLEHLAKYPPERLIAENRGTGSTHDGWFDIRDRGQALVFQTFLHNLDTLAKMPDFNVFWLWFVGSMERHMKDKQGVSDYFSESLKNLILVMHSARTFEEASKRSGQDLWALTWAVLDRPEMKEQLTQSLQQDHVVMAPPHTPKSQHLVVSEQLAPNEQSKASEEALQPSVQSILPSQQMVPQFASQLSFPVPVTNGTPPCTFHQTNTLGATPFAVQSVSPELQNIQ